MSRSIRGALVGAALLTLLPLAIASAHAELESASPGPDEVVEGSPSRLVARFTQDISADRTSIEVRDANGLTIARGGKDPERARVQRVDLPPLEAGTYEVRWVTFSSEDDELARGRYRFTVIAAPATTQPTLAPSSPCPSPILPAANATPLGSVAPIAAPATLAPTTSPAPATLAPAATPIPVATPDPCAPAPATPQPSPGASTSAASPEASVVP